MMSSTESQNLNQQKWAMGVDPGQNLPPEAAQGPWRDLRAVKEKKVIDAHVHSYETPAQGHNYKEAGHMHELHQWKDYTDDMIASMDRHGIAQCALIPAFVTYETVLETSFKAYPDRIIRAAGLPTESTKAKSSAGAHLPGAEAPLTPTEFAAILRKQLVEDGCKYVGESAGNAIPRALMPKYSLKDLKPVIDLVLEFDVPVQFHTGWTATGTAIGSKTYSTSGKWAETLGSLMAAYPEMKVILGHTGGRFAALDGWEAVRLMFSFDNIYCDTAKSTPEIVGEVVRGIGAERVLFGSDWNRPELKTYGPYHMRQVYQHWYNLNTIAQADLTDDQRDWILYKSAKKLLKLS